MRIYAVWLCRSAAQTLLFRLAQVAHTALIEGKYADINQPAGLQHHPSDRAEMHIHGSGTQVQSEARTHLRGTKVTGVDVQEKNEAIGSESDDVAAVLAQDTRSALTQNTRPAAAAVQFKKHGRGSCHVTCQDSTSCTQGS